MRCPRAGSDDDGTVPTAFALRLGLRKCASLAQALLRFYNRTALGGIAVARHFGPTTGDAPQTGPGGRAENGLWH